MNKYSQYISHFTTKFHFYRFSEILQWLSKTRYERDSKRLRFPFLEFFAMVKSGHSRKYTQKNLVCIYSWLFKNFTIFIISITVRRPTPTSGLGGEVVRVRAYIVILDQILISWNSAKLNHLKLVSIPGNFKILILKPYWFR